MGVGLLGAPWSHLSSSTQIEVISKGYNDFGMVGEEYMLKRMGERGDPWRSPDTKSWVVCVAP